ncbi:MAG: four helix bundle protein [Bacteroidales bacterium]
MKTNLSERFLDFAAKIIKLALRLNKTAVGRHIGNQLMRSGTSAGANYEEACGAESRADFAHKLQVVFKELKESLFWLKLIKRSELLPTEDEQLNFLLKESHELTNIIGKSVVTTKSNYK